MDPPDFSPTEHRPVLLREVLEFLNCMPGRAYVDATLGLGGHASGILDLIEPDGLLIGVDRDKESLQRAVARLRKSSARFLYFHENFKNLPLILNNLEIPPLDGLLLDLGVSSYQLLSPERGFSFHSDEPLDMRMDRSQRQTAADLVNYLREEELAEIIREFGEERHARRIAAAIVNARMKKRIARCSELAQIVALAAPSRTRDGIHPATRTFQAIRIAVNEELEGLEGFFTDVLPFMRTGGRFVVISFHSLEDRIVKQTFKKLAGQCVCGRSGELCICPRKTLVSIVTPRPVRPGSDELKANPRARSARLRVAERI
jgi:16S rRNA (cytosine1402-N4)-methyltransferase